MSEPAEAEVTGPADAERADGEGAEPPKEPATAAEPAKAAAPADDAAWPGDGADDGPVLRTAAQWFLGAGIMLMLPRQYWAALGCALVAGALYFLHRRRRQRTSA